MIIANLDFSDSSGGLRHSSAFNALDPTEKGWVNFSLGMVFAKICAARFLNVPWLMHFKWFKMLNDVAMLPGGSTPDFIGLSPSNGQHHVIEAKGRNSGYSKAVMAKAKTQASQPVSVNGSTCSLHIGTLLYREANGSISMAIEDPESDDQQGFELCETRETWAAYYQTVWGLSQMTEAQKEAFRSLTGLTVGINDVVKDEIAALMGADDAQSAQEALNRLKKWSASEPDSVLRRMRRPERWDFADGITLAYAPPERKRRGDE